MIAEAITPYTRSAVQPGGTLNASGHCILGVRCCWVFGTSFRCVCPYMQWVCPYRRVPQYHVLAEYLSGILPRNALIDLVW